jgi:hypothetical protein
MKNFIFIPDYNSTGKEGIEASGESKFDFLQIQRKNEISWKSAIQANVAVQLQQRTKC